MKRTPDLTQVGYPDLDVIYGGKATDSISSGSRPCKLFLASRKYGVGTEEAIAGSVIQKIERLTQFNLV